MNKPTDIIILQISMGGITAVAQILRSYDIDRDQDYVGINTADDIERLIYSNEPQLLITGIISDQVADLHKMIRRLRQMNPRLVVVIYSSISSLNGDFDRQIEKRDDDCRDKLMQAIVQFRNGTFRREK